MKIRTLTILSTLLLLAMLPLAAQEDLDITAPDGATLKATYYDPGAPGPGVMLFHQCNSDRKSWIPLATKLAAKGFHVFTLDSRGYGESAGGDGDGRNETLSREEFRPMREKWATDIESAYKVFAAMEGVDTDRLGAGGASCGVHNSIRLASKHPGFKTLVMLSGGTREAEAAYIRSTEGLSLFGAASADDGGTPERMREIIESSPNSDSKLVTYESAGHGVPMFSAEPELLPMVVKWFTEHLQ